MTKARNIASANPAPTTVSTTELGYVDGVTSAIQTQIDAKLATTLADAKGDLIVATADNVFGRLPVSTSNGDTIVADSSTSTGLRYTAGTVSNNPVLNSAMQIAQRGTSVSLAASSSGYTLDRWFTVTGANQAMTIARQATGDTTNLPNIQYCLRYQRNSGQTGTAGTNLVQSFETVNSIPFAGKTVTMSFYARAGANYSPTSSALGVYLIAGTGTDQNWASGYTGQTLPVNSSATLTTTWQRFTYTGAVGATVTELSTVFAYNPTGTAGANDYFEITGVQIDIGSVALPFRTNAGTIQGELAACQRYFQIYGSSSQDFAGSTYSTTAGRLYKSLPVIMRIAPVATFPAAPYTNYIGEVGTATRTPTAFATVNNSPSAIAFDATGMTGANAYRPIDWAATASIQFSSEL